MDPRSQLCHNAECPERGVVGGRYRAWSAAAMAAVAVSRDVPPAKSIGVPKQTEARPGRGSTRPLGSDSNRPGVRIGTTGSPSWMAIRPTPRFNGPIAPVVDRVPSGKKSMDQPRSCKRAQCASTGRTSADRARGEAPTPRPTSAPTRPWRKSSPGRQPPRSGGARAPGATEARSGCQDGWCGSPRTGPVGRGSRSAPGRAPRCGSTCRADRRGTIAANGA